MNKVFINIINIISLMNTTICISEKTKNKFLEGKRRYCVRNRGDYTADEYLTYLLERD